MHWPLNYAAGKLSLHSFARQSRLFVRCLARCASRLARRSSLVRVGFRVAAKADTSLGFADNGCGFLVVSHRDKFTVPEVSAVRPLNEGDLAHEIWLDPPAFFHLLGSQ